MLSPLPAAGPSTGASPGCTELAATGAIRGPDLHQLLYPLHLAQAHTVPPGPDRSPV